MFEIMLCIVPFVGMCACLRAGLSSSWGMLCVERTAVDLGLGHNVES